MAPGAESRGPLLTQSGHRLLVRRLCKPEKSNRHCKESEERVFDSETPPTSDLRTGQIVCVTHPIFVVPIRIDLKSCHRLFEVPGESVFRRHGVLL